MVPLLTLQPDFAVLKLAISMDKTVTVKKLSKSFLQLGVFLVKVFE